jgi:hypothetical protein
MSSVVEAYEQVIKDFGSDIGWEPGVQEDVIAALEHRLFELREVWGEK